MSPGVQYAIIGGLAAALVLAGWMVLFKDQRAQIQTRTAELEKLQIEIDRANSLKKRLAEFEVELESLERKLGTLVKILPSEKDVEVLIRRIENQARQSNLEVKQFDPRDTVGHDFYAEWPIFISVQGTYHNLGLFFDRISKFDRIINVSDLTSSALRGRGSASGNTLSASFVATTFVFLR
jgi:type IV pilus assembly protein PilO